MRKGIEKQLKTAEGRSANNKNKLLFLSARRQDDLLFEDATA